MRNHLTVVVKVTEGCNLNCKYCYVRENLVNSIMDNKTLENSLRKTLEEVDYANFCWHGGEPLLAGIKFYEKAIKIQKEYTKKGKVIKNTIQTNGTLISKEWAEFFKKNNFSIGISLDGPKELHNVNRIYTNKNGSFEKVLEGIKILKKEEVYFGILTVINKKNYKKAKELYNFMKNSEFDFKTNPYIASGKGKKFKDELYITPEQFAEFSIALFDLWFNDPNPTIKEKHLASIVKGFIQGKIKECTYFGNCSQDYLAIDPNGEIYPCGRYIGEEKFRYENINKINKISEIFNSKIYKNFVKRKPEDCAKCEYWELCHGGCSHRSYIENGNINKVDPMCKARKMIYSHIYNKLKNTKGVIKE